MPEPRRAFRTLVGLHLRALRGQVPALAIFTLALPLGLAAALNAQPTLTMPAAPGSLPTMVEHMPPDAIASQRASLIVAQALVAVLLGVAWVVLPQQLARMRETRQFGFFAGFAVGRATYLLALVTTYAIAALPGVLLVPAVTALALHVPLRLGAALVALVPLCFVALAATGSVVGLARLSTAATTALSCALYVLSLGLLWVLTTTAAPTLALVAPSSLAANLLTAPLPHLGTSAVALDVVGLLIYTIGGAYGVVRLLPWRADATLPQAQP